MPQVSAYGARSAQSTLSPLTIERREVGANDVQVEIMYCGVCHSDLHTVRNEWQNTTYPAVPGHEIIGRVTKVGAKVTKYKEGEVVGVGCMVDSCRTCESCKAGLENYCESPEGLTATYNSPDKHTGKMTYGGYSTSIVVDEHFVLKIKATKDLAAVAPLLCAGITTYSPLRHWGVKKGMRVGIVGLGGLGHMALKLSHAFGANTVLFTTSAGKADDAKKLGADEVVVSKDAAAMEKQANKFDLILDTVSANHDTNAYLNLLKRDGTLVQVGAPEQLPVIPFGLIFKRRTIAGSLIGGIPETQEMLDFCAERGIVSDVEVIPMENINEAYERMLKSDVKYRFVIDMQSLKK